MDIIHIAKTLNLERSGKDFFKDDFMLVNYNLTIGHLPYCQPVINRITRCFLTQK